ncbi:MAG: UbiX family flavin prenyltransferase [Bacteroides sp.]|nr:MAG: UbiX family flavin prenyltransferase [Bacteroides sp.]
MRKIVIAITGASGSVYANYLLNHINQCEYDISIVMSKNAKYVWHHELKNDDYKKYNIYDNNDFRAPFASGSSQHDTMIIIPCSMGVLGRISSGISSDLITRCADAMLKERKKIVFVIRETPYNIIHINNMKTITEAGGIILPATPSFYSIPKNISDVIKTVVDRIFMLTSINTIDNNFYRWGNKLY